MVPIRLICFKTKVVAMHYLFRLIRKCSDRFLENIEALQTILFFVLRPLLFLFLFQKQLSLFIIFLKRKNTCWVKARCVLLFVSTNMFVQCFFLWVLPLFLQSFQPILYFLGVNLLKRCLFYFYPIKQRQIGRVRFSRIVFHSLFLYRLVKNQKSKYD